MFDYDTAKDELTWAPWVENRAVVWSRKLARLEREVAVGLVL